MAEVLNFSDFLLKSPDIIARFPSLVFVGSTDYPLLFFARFVSYLKTKHAVPIQLLNGTEVDAKTLVNQLSITFLGEKKIYWLQDMTTSINKDKKFWHAYCNQYAGPNSLWCFIQDVDTAIACAKVIMPTVIDKALFQSLCLFFEITPHKSFVGQLFKIRSSISLDAACLLIEYMQLIGNDAQGISEIVSCLIGSDESLFLLASLFLAKKTTEFYDCWHKVYAQYSEQFWCSFFSDLLWRGSQYIRLAQENDMIAARKIAYRLPFSFIKSDWRKLRQKELTTAHAFIYDADFRFKNGAGYGAFDLFFSSFFLDSFV